LEQAVRPWQKPWSATHIDGRVVLPLRHDGVAYRGVNIITLWMASIAKGNSAGCRLHRAPELPSTA
jgi:antirestriction protein ArdC